MPADHDAAVQKMERRFGPVTGRDCRAVRAPYRLSPLGAHTDHQDGLTSGFTIDRGITLTWRPVDAAEVRLVSEDHDGEARMKLATSEEPYADDWSAYVEGVVRIMCRDHRLRRGIEGVIVGELAPGGISTSAALQVAVMLALAEANGIDIEPGHGADLVRAAEQASTGVSVGLLDPTTILNGRERTFVMIDCRDGTVRLHRFARNTPDFAWFIIDSGVPRWLKGTPYNDRVSECREASRLLGSTADVPVLRDITPEEYRRRRNELSPVSVRRAEHYFSEVKRVKLGMQALARGDLVGLGRLMWASSDSLTTNFECGTPETRSLLDALRSGDGVLGASYAGGGWGGMIQVLAEPGAKDAVERCVASYAKACPDAGASAAVHQVGMGPGARAL